MRNSDPKMVLTNPCPCCGHMVFEGLGTDEICPVCYWQDDLLCLLQPFDVIGPNKISLADAQINFIATGLSDTSYENARGRLVKPDTFPIDKGWRPIDRELDRFASPESAQYPEDENQAYYWRADYWLK